MRTCMFMAGIALCVFALSACGGKPAQPTMQPATESAHAAHPAVSNALTAAVRNSLRAYHLLSVRSLWSNAIGSRPVAIAGPALSDLRNALAQRRQRGIRVRLLSDRFHITSISLAPSFTTATALVVDPQRVQPYGYDGRPLGHAVRLDEGARIELHRVDRSPRFVVWKVGATK